MADSMNCSKEIQFRSIGFVFTMLSQSNRASNRCNVFDGELNNVTTENHASTSPYLSTHVSLFDLVLYFENT